MKGKDLLDKMELTNSSYVEAADNVKIKKVNFKKYVLIAACAAAIVAAVGIPAIANRDKNNKTHIIEKTPVVEITDNRYIIKHIQKDSASADENNEVFIPLPHWEEMINPQRYSILNYNGLEYDSRLIAVHGENTGELLGEASVSGQDYYTDEIHSLVGNVYKIKGIDEKAAVCFKFNEADQYTYAYANYDYTPYNLDEFINVLDLRNNLKTDIVYDEREKDTVAYEDIATDMIWDMLLSDATVKNEPEKDNADRTIFSISASVDVLGYHYYTIGLTDDGYLWTNILETGKYFYIGEEKVNAFIKEVTENHQGYIYIYDELTDTDLIEE